MNQIYSFLIAALGGVFFWSLLNEQMSMLVIPLSVVERKHGQIDLPSRPSEPTRSKQSGTVSKGASIA